MSTTVKLDSALAGCERGGETVGERLVRIETILSHFSLLLQQHIRDSEKELLTMKDDFKAHLNSTGTVGEDVRALTREVHALVTRVGELEEKVAYLSNWRMTVIAWAAGVSASVSAFWLVAGDHITKVFRG